MITLLKFTLAQYTVSCQRLLSCNFKEPICYELFAPQALHALQWLSEYEARLVEQFPAPASGSKGGRCGLEIRLENEGRKEKGLANYCQPLEIIWRPQSDVIQSLKNLSSR